MQLLEGYINGKNDHLVRVEKYKKDSVTDECVVFCSFSLKKAMSQKARNRKGFMFFINLFKMYIYSGVLSGGGNCESSFKGRKNGGI